MSWFSVLAVALRSSGKTLFRSTIIYWTELVQVGLVTHRAGKTVTYCRSVRCGLRLSPAETEASGGIIASNCSICCSRGPGSCVGQKLLSCGVAITKLRPTRKVIQTNTYHCKRVIAVRLAMGIMRSLKRCHCCFAYCHPALPDCKLRRRSFCQPALCRIFWTNCASPLLRREPERLCSKPCARRRNCFVTIASLRR